MEKKMETTIVYWGYIGKTRLLLQGSLKRLNTNAFSMVKLRGLKMTSEPIASALRSQSVPFATIVYWGYIGIMEKKMETTIVYWGE